MSFASLSKAQETVDINKEALKRYLSKCELEELKAYETELSLADCINNCKREWYESASFMLPVALSLAISAYLAGLKH